MGFLTDSDLSGNDYYQDWLSEHVAYMLVLPCFHVTIPDQNLQPLQEVVSLSSQDKWWLFETFNSIRDLA